MTDTPSSYSSKNGHSRRRKGKKHRQIEPAETPSSRGSPFTQAESTDVAMDATGGSGKQSLLLATPEIEPLSLGRGDGDGDELGAFMHEEEEQPVFAFRGEMDGVGTLADWNGCSSDENKNVDTAMGLSFNTPSYLITRDSGNVNDIATLSVDNDDEVLPPAAVMVSSGPHTTETGLPASNPEPSHLDFREVAATEEYDPSPPPSLSLIHSRSQSQSRSQSRSQSQIRVDTSQVHNVPNVGFGDMSDLVIPATRPEEPEPVLVPAVTRLDSPPPVSPPPRSAGRTRAPILASRSPVSPSSLSRKLQNVQAILPSSPHLPSIGGFSNPLANFAAPRISNVTVSGSSFNHPTSQPAAADPFSGAKEARRRSTGNFGDTRDRDRARLRMTQAPSRSSESDEEDPVIMPTSATTMKHIGYPSSNSGSKDKVVFSSFAVLEATALSAFRRLLFVGYENGLQIWDISHLGEVREILNRRMSGAVVGCSVLPAPRIKARHPSLADEFAKQRPLIGIVIEEHDANYFMVYSLATHEVVKKLDFSGATVTSIQASNSFIVVSTVQPSSLHILCSRTLNILHTIQSRQIFSFSRPVSIHTSEGSVETTYTARQDRPHPVFTLSSRLLAFASISTSPDSSSLTNIYPRMAVPHSPSIQLGPIHVSQADIGNAAMKVGGGLLSGMKTLGGLAVAAARGERASSATSAEGGGFRKFFSRSAPAATPTVLHSRSVSESMTTTTDIYNRQSSQGVSHPTALSSSQPDAVHVTILDLQPLLDDFESGRPECLSDFTVSSGQTVAGLKFSEDGNNIAVVPDDGGTVRLYQIKPRSRTLRTAALNNSIHSLRDKPALELVRQDSVGGVENPATLPGDETFIDNAPWHVYDLRRGRTSGIIESVQYSYDSRWVGISTRKRTIHVFATNPYGGKPDDASHLEGRVKNVDEIPPLSTELKPIVRLRSNPVTSREQHSVPLVFTFISSSESLPTKFLPAFNTFSPPSSVTSSTPPSVPHRRTQSVSPRLPARPTNYQDILIFDPSDGTLSLRRMVISVRVGDVGSSFLASLPIPTATSISLPGMGLMGFPAVASPKMSATTSSSSTNENVVTELVAKDSTVATWNLMRDSKWSDVKEPLNIENTPQQRRVISKSEWLAQAELSTYSRSTHILPSSIYLSHQFSFFALLDDYHALIRRLHFDIRVEKIIVRREVQASAYTSGHGESFVSAASSPKDVRGVRSFDEPLASAIYTGLDYSGSSPPVIPMLPNGVSGSYKSTIPIRSVAAGFTEGVNESLGLISRGLRKVRSPKLNPRPDESRVAVPLEFDEADEEFLSEREQVPERDDLNDLEEDGRFEQARMNEEHELGTDTMSNSACEGRDSRSVSTPSTRDSTPLPEEPEEWLDDMDAVEEAERFDEISAAGMMDEEQQMPIRVSGLDQKRHFSRKGGKGR